MDDSTKNIINEALKWAIVYKRAEYQDGSLLFPERLTKEFLTQQRKVMGSYLYANQYLNEVIPDDERKFKKSWFRYVDILPQEMNTFGFIDPAIGLDKHHDFTGVVVIGVDTDKNWYVLSAKRYKITPTEIVSKIFEVYKQFDCKCVGIETVAYQESLLYFLDEEMRRRNVIVPVKGIKQRGQTKEARILGLVPRIEWGKLYFKYGLTELEDELLSFPRGSHDDIIDALCSMDEIVYYPEKKKENLEKPASPHDPRYESWAIRNLTRKANDEQDNSDNY